MKRRAVLASGLALLTGPAAAKETSLELGQARATLEIEGKNTAALTVLVRHWVTQSAAAVIGYYGRFPVPAVEVVVSPVAGAGVRGGRTFPGDVPSIQVRAGLASSEDDLLRKDWVMVHEMTHLAFPWMNRRNNWMAEGLAVYVEPIARLQAGQLTAANVWGDFVRMMPRGLPGPSDGGFDITVNWGRTYWGGAMFCLVADIAIRQATGNAKGLQQALRAINAVRDFRRQWDFIETLEIGDKATGTKVLTAQYQAMRIEPVSPDLTKLWRDLGISLDGATVKFNDDAPLASIRRAIETPI